MQNDGYFRNIRRTIFFFVITLIFSKLHSAGVGFLISYLPKSVLTALYLAKVAYFISSFFKFILLQKLHPNFLENK